ncbi:hypothetical protein COU74_01310 [Candidatus Peregrinibacteria bacterium CG10_big_fil_rev_8_21_14_0_10_36_19]|nr:MAG: hypothetical protein COU74_01310 [Candidatus Peregrinibacteria bacterium CG10_big_fil_rev_8_21_14_0_10_36_19]
MMRFVKTKKGVSLIEVLIAVSLFAIVATISSNILVDTVKLQKKSSLSSTIYEDLRIIVQQITNEVQNGAIDYEEYYNIYVLQNGKSAQDTYYGINYGAYGSRFYDPGIRIDGATPKNPNDLGVECSYPETVPVGEDCQVIYTLSTDLNTGRSPYYGNTDDTNAFCDKSIGKCNEPGVIDQLFLIDKTGKKKTILGKKKTSNNDYAVGIMRMDGLDIDQNGVIDTFTCNENFSCIGDGTGEDSKVEAAIKLPFFSTTSAVKEYGIRLPHASDLEDVFDVNSSQFVPITPLRTTVKDLKFIIKPLDDPYKAYAEEKMQSHPTVTVIITLGLSDLVKDLYPGDFPDVKIQTTIASGVLNRIDSYPPISEVKDKANKDTWLKDVFPLSLTSPY